MKNIETYFDDELQSVIWEINGFVSFDDFVTIAKQTHLLRSANNSNKQLNNIKNMKVLSKEIQAWIDKEYFPKAKNSGLKYFAFVVPDNTFGKLSMTTVNNNASKKYNMEIEYFDNEQLAKDWLNSKN